MWHQNVGWQSGSVLFQPRQRHLDQHTDQVSRQSELSIVDGAAVSDKCSEIMTVSVT